MTRHDLKFENEFLGMVLYIDYSAFINYLRTIYTLLHGIDLRYNIYLIKIQKRIVRTVF